MALLLYNSGRAFLLHWAQTEDKDALEKALIVTRQSVECTPEGDDGLANRLCSLGACAFAMFKHTNRMEDLDNGIDAFRRAAQLVPNNHPTQSSSRALLYLQDIDAVLSASRKTAATGTDESGHNAWALYHLGNQLDFKYVNTGNVECLHEAIQACSKALDLPHEDNVIRAKVFALRGKCLRESFEHTGDVAELERAVADCKLAAKIMSEDHHALPGILQRLAFSFQEQYQLSGEMMCLQKAIKTAHRSLRLASIYGHAMSKFLSTLGGILLRRYSATLRLRDLDDAIHALCESLKNEAQMPRVVSATNMDILASCLGTRYHRSGDQRDLEGAEYASRQAVEVAPANHAGLPAYLANLGSYLMDRFQATRKPNYLKESMHTFARALDQVRSPLHAQLCLGVMAGCRRIVYMITQNDEHLEAAIKICRKSIAVLSTESDIIANSQDELALLQCQNPDDQGEALGLSLQVWNSLRASPFGRVKAASSAIKIYIDQSNLEKAYTLVIAAINVIPLVHNRSLTLQDQQEVVQVFSGLATDAFSLALRTKRPLLEALDLLERGRGVILSLLMNDRSDTVKRRKTHPAKYRFGSLSVAQGGPEAPAENVQFSPAVDSSEKRITEEEVKAGAARGRIIIVNITSVGSDALILSSTGLKVIHLRGLDSDEVRDWIKKDMTATSGNRGANNKAYLRFLSWLWRVCIKPILNELEYKVHDSPEEMPRAWWIGTGLASSFPFHAAGNHLTEPNESTNSRPLSDQEIHRPKLLTVSMATTPGADDLDVGNYVHAECLSQPDADTVKSRLSGCHIAHFACHGVSEPRDPSQSGLLFQTVVGSLCDIDCSQGQIAYLSACSTAENRSRWLVDEVLHVVSGFQVAGFRNVIGCLWPADDTVCAEIAKPFYSELCRGGKMECNDGAVSLALHKAVLKISRSPQYCKWPLHWAQYVHFGT
ncbi:CHAT domain-containing protein [Aspergillus pseudotamarii]|uniref:CHAT domain-containing protein n=1 Tax=Aspergillus pseudotamarii TaxID=132259 RepID=A0A5N6TAW9_ASPPS|nr:CHAT domain-containing protein [Aspergillus pseudotamarii]KAE8143436.1 CHAT domain-containing protein [Aspergillus pseudotamarii]